MSNEEKIYLLHAALKKIASYDTTERLRKNSSKDWGLDYDEALEMAYENMQAEATTALKGFRLPSLKIKL